MRCLRFQVQPLDAIRNAAAQAKGLDVEAISVPGDHFTAVDPAIQQGLDSKSRTTKARQICCQLRGKR